MFFKYDEVTKLTESEVRDSLVNALTLIDSLMESLTEKNLMVNELSEMVDDYKNQCIEMQESNDSLRFTVDYLKQKNSDLEDIVIRDNEISDYYNNLISDMENEITDLNNQIIEEQNRYDNLDNAYNELNQEIETLSNEKRLLQCQLKDISNKYERDEKIINKVYEMSEDIDNIETMKKDIEYYKQENERLIKVKNHYKNLYRETLRNN